MVRCSTLFFQAEDGIRDTSVTGVQTCALPISTRLGEKQEARLLTDRAHSPGASLNVTFSPDGKRLATGRKEYTVKIWDVETGRSEERRVGKEGRRRGRG